MKSLSFTLLCFLISFLCASHINEAADPTCSKGIAKQKACCPKVCNQCGGGGCFKKSQDLGTRCCSSGILNPALNVPSCNTADPPCRITSTTSDPTCSTGIPTDRGACCKKACGKCGGNGCGARSKNASTRCCIGAILNPKNNVPSCNNSLPPCIIKKGNASPSPSPKANNNNSKYSSTDGKWVTAEVKGTRSVFARHEACAIMVDGKVVVIGGRGFKPVNIYDPVSKTWTQKSRYNMQTQIHHFQCVAYKSTIYIIASWDKGFPDEINNPVGFKYHVPTDKWSTFKGLREPRRRAGAGSVLIGTKIYLIAGNRGGHGEQAIALPWVDAYDIEKDEWIENALPDVPEAGRDHTGAAVMFNGDICIASGRDGGSAGFFRLNFAATWCYSFKNKKWNKKADIPQPRAGAMVGTTCEGYMMVAGGEGNGKAYKRVDVFNGEKWIRGPDFVEARHGSGLAFSNCNTCGHIFVPSGSGRQGGSPELKTTEEYIPSNSPKNCAKY